MQPTPFSLCLKWDVRRQDVPVEPDVDFAELARLTSGVEGQRWFKGKMRPMVGIIDTLFSYYTTTPGAQGLAEGIVIWPT